ncbi:MAG: DNA polymerase III subunit delta [Actinobacteria bacterium]|nr:DNA polymerase III subunit delta [Actinomycetota bacterium]NDA38643.1 DNA polymerase III subunit delta [Actinomycetota bacterium]NDE12062.1 DNA polymerase III subunit delta [Actinomycetota bacterium]NDE83378.1 DNA polymerase III subunit delta [Actinomycetota bacterium]
MALTPVVLIHGSEAALSDRALNEALSLRKDFERTTLDGSELELGRFSEVIAPSLFSERRVVVIRDLQDVIGEVGEEILASFEAIDPNTHLIFLHRGGVKGKGLVEKIKKQKSEYIACEPLKKQSEKEGFVREEFARHGRKISPAAVVALVNATGSDTRELAAACSQIAFDTNAGKAQIDEGDIANYYQGRVEATGFDVADAVVAGDVKGTLITLRQALDTGTDPVMIISAVANSVRAIAKVSDVPRNAKSFELAGTLGLAPWQIDKARRQLTRWRPGMITFAINELARADYGVKGGEADPIYALERAMVAIAKNIASGGSV